MVGVRCRRDDAKSICGARREAIHAGEMYYSAHHGGWIFPAEHRAVPQLLQRLRIPPYIWTHCPFCGQPLPDEVSAAEQLLAKPPEWTGEDGG